MENIYNQILDKIVISINKPEFNDKLNQHLIIPLIKNIQLKTYKYIVYIVILYTLIIILLLIIISLIINKKI